MVEKVVTRRLFRGAFEIGPLVEAVECGLDDVRILSGLDLLFQSVTFGAAGDVDESGHPVERREQLVLDRARLDVARPADDHWRSVAAFPSLALLAFERRHAPI